MKKSDRRLKLFAYMSVFVCMIIQIVLIFSYKDNQQLADYEQYIKLATECLSRGHWYPDLANVHDDYMFAPGLVNYFILQLKLFGTMTVNLWLNWLLNLGIFFFTYRIAYRFFNLRTACISIIASALMYSTWWIVIPAGTEVPYLFLSLLGLWLVVENKKWCYFVLAGIVFGLANWIRPLVLVFLITTIALMYVYKFKLKSYVSLLIGFCLTLAVIGVSSYKSINRVVLQSTTSGINLAFTANDRAYGGVACTLIADTSNLCNIKNAPAYTYFQKDSIWRTRAIGWIKEHPLKYAGLYAIKIPGLFVEDTWPDRAVLPGASFVDRFFHGQIPLSTFLAKAVVMVSKSVVFYFICIVFLIGLWTRRKDIFTRRGIILIPVFLGIAVTCIFCVSPKYHYPFLFAMVIWAAYTIDRYLVNL